MNILCGMEKVACDSDREDEVLEIREGSKRSRRRTAKAKQSSLRKVSRVLRGDLRRRLAKSGKRRLVMLGSRDRGRDYAKDEKAKKSVEKRI